MCIRGGRTTAGFTLIELLAVLAILTLLMSLSVMVFKGGSDKARVAQTVARMKSLESLIASYQAKVGDYPTGSLKKLKIKCDNDLNEGIEACLAALYSKDYPNGASLGDDVLGNTDQDSTGTNFHRDGSDQLVEVLDGWGNPLAYFHNEDYGKNMPYHMGESSTVPDQFVSARRSEVTKVWAQADSYQIVSAGSDGEFGTEDDVTSWDSH